MSEYSLEWSFGFGLSRRPFLMAPNPEYLVSVPQVVFARDTLLRCISRGEGIGILLGESGVGKTLMCQTLYSQLMSQESVADLNQLVLIQRGVIHSGIELDAAILSAAGVEVPRRSMIRSTLEQFLNSLEYGLLVIMDSADHLSMSAWLELQNLANFCHEGRVSIQWILSGTALLEERLAHPRLVSLNQQIAARVALHAFNMSETQEYLDSLIRAVKGEPRKIFTEQGCRKIYHLTDGIPRLINLLGDHVLWNGLQSGEEGPFGESAIADAWQEIEGIVTRKNNASQQSSDTTASSVESARASKSSTLTKSADDVDPTEDSTVSFGELDDDDSSEPTDFSTRVIGSMDTMEEKSDIEVPAASQSPELEFHPKNQWQDIAPSEVQQEDVHSESISLPSPSNNLVQPTFNTTWTEPQSIRISARSVTVEHRSPDYITPSSRPCVSDKNKSASDHDASHWTKLTGESVAFSDSDWHIPLHATSPSEDDPRTTRLFSRLRRRHPF